MMLSYHLGSKFIIIICDSVNFAFLYFHIKIKINHTYYFHHNEMIIDIGLSVSYRKGGRQKYMGPDEV